MIPEGTRFIGIAPTVNLKERKSAQLNAETQPYTLDDIRGSSYKVFTAVLTQSGVNSDVNATSGLLIVGVSYLIDIYNAGDDFSNVGGPAAGLQGEWDGSSFLATGTTPSNWNNLSSLNYKTGAPKVLAILENTTGINPVFTYEDAGAYVMDFFELFTPTEGFYKTAIFYTNRRDYSYIPVTTIDQRFPNTNQFFISSTTSLSGGPFTAGERANGLLFGTIEIRVYN
jgi:hypothetical protein